MLNEVPAAERPWEHIPDTFGNVEDISDALIAREQDVFLLGDYSGNVTPGNRRGLGLYYRDARHLSAYALQLDGTWPNVLLTTADTGHSWEQVLGNHRFEQAGNLIGRCTIELHRRRIVGADGFEEQLSVTNFNPFPVNLRLAFLLDADFADMFEVRGHQRSQAGRYEAARVDSRRIEYGYQGADGVHRYTRVEFNARPVHANESQALFDLALEAGSTKNLAVSVLVGQGTAKIAEDWQAIAQRKPRADWQREFAQIETSNETFNGVLQRALSDLRMLWTVDDSGRSYLAAGTPWFATLFGRDSIIVALQMLPFMPDIARECLSLLSHYQGIAVDASRCEEPGKILHEMRRDELSSIGELPYGRYYGSVDSTPLFLILAAEYLRWSGDLTFISALLPSLQLALQWLGTFGDPDGDGFVEYHTDSKDGLRNQGWKDSADAIIHADGSLCEGPIALAEVQGYAYAAFEGMAYILETLARGDEAASLRGKAANLRTRFEQQFWLPDEGYVALALDGDKRPARVMTSNAGQVLWSGIMPAEAASTLAERLMRPDMFCGWGVKTLSAGNARHNPLGYHLGTVWPHDNAIIAAGLKRYAADHASLAIFDGLLDAVRMTPDLRLPELFGGHARGQYTRPVPYPVACRPQAWTAGAWFHLLQTLLGLSPDAAKDELVCVRPQLPAWLPEMRIRRLRVGKKVVDLKVRQNAGNTQLEIESGAAPLRIA